MKRLAFVMVALAAFPLGCPQAHASAATTEPASVFPYSWDVCSNTFSPGPNAAPFPGRSCTETACALIFFSLVRPFLFYGRSLP